jgi:hypothetical protein
MPNSGFAKLFSALDGHLRRRRNVRDMPGNNAVGQLGRCVKARLQRNIDDHGGSQRTHGTEKPQVIEHLRNAVGLH